MKCDISRNLLLIKLAVELQGVVKDLPTHKSRSSRRITKKSLAEEYWSDGLSSSQEGARKKASRYINEIEKVFGLKGSVAAGFEMDKRFKTFREMFEYWLEKISPPEDSDKRLHVMLTGLIQVIENAFKEDPIVIPNLAKQLQAKYGNKNIRDTKEPLHELFDCALIVDMLDLIEDDDEFGINISSNPLLLRLKSYKEVGSNQDQSIHLARSGCIYVALHHTIKDLEPEQQTLLQEIAKHISDTIVWNIDGEDILPYILFREGESGPLMLTVRNLNKNHFDDICINHWTDIPKVIRSYIPLGVDEKVWNSFKQISRC